MINKEPSLIFHGRSMRTKNVVYFLSLLLMSSVFVYCAGAQTNNVSFHGAGVTVDLAYPEEAHPSNTTAYNETITHDISIRNDTPSTLQSFTMVVTAVVNQSLEVIYSGQDTLTHPLPFTYNLTIPLPLGTNGSLQCSVYVRTSGTGLDDLHFTVQTTEVRTLTYTELLFEYNQLMENYTALNNSYVALNNTYNDLRILYNATLQDYNRTLLEYQTLNTTYNGLYSDYGILNSTYNSLNSTYYSLRADYNLLEGNYNSILAKNNALQLDYNSIDSTHSNLQTIYNSLLSTKNTLQTNYNSLNSTYYSVQASYALLRGAYDSLNRTYTALENEINTLTQRITGSENALNNDRVVMFIFVAAVAGLVAFVIYLKQKKPEPYVVIRKETVTMEQDEKQ